ncbi:hypothetical protein O181_075275 [Austropuccinia psidii MF-1]|uniref:Uncharacterized protein n=1 Tax=Austropuccinia psidii MF-1 TaxID=1389203 RepID=A0A9Q3F6B2_9BASI|nr:hypothetical protein [Austropuccinia psidii MF-1]
MRASESTAATSHWRATTSKKGPQVRATGKESPPPAFNDSDWTPQVHPNFLRHCGAYLGFLDIHQSAILHCSSKSQYKKRGPSYRGWHLPTPPVGKIDMTCLMGNCTAHAKRAECFSSRAIADTKLASPTASTGPRMFLIGFEFRLLILVLVLLVSAPSSTLSSTQVCTNGMINPKGAKMLLCDTPGKSYLCPPWMCSITVDGHNKTLDNYYFENCSSARPNSKTLPALHPYFFNLQNDNVILVHNGWILRNGKRQQIDDLYACYVGRSKVNSIRPQCDGCTP